MRWHLYIVKCRDGSFYTGITTDIARRIDQHNKGTASRYTRSRLPVTLLYSESRKDRSAALRREFAIKAMSREEKEQLIVASKVGGTAKKQKQRHKE